MDSKRFRPVDNRTLPEHVFTRRTEINPYIEQIYHYPDWVCPHPTPESFPQLWKDQMNSAQRLHVEIGSGAGQYLLEWSGRFPEDCFVGFELRYKRLVTSAKKLKTHQRSNAFLLREKGEYLEDYIHDIGLDVLHVNFPDPWPKKSQKKHRLLSQTYLKNLHSLLRSEGCVYFKTDHHEYFHSVESIVKVMKEYEIEDYTTDLHKSVFQENNIETEFEQLFKSKGNPPIAFMKLRKVPLHS